MSARTDWQIEAHSLVLRGELTYKTLLPLWQEKETLLNSITLLDVSALTHVDSSGLALIVQFISNSNANGNAIKITGITDKLNTLITLYNLNDIIGDSL